MKNTNTLILLFASFFSLTFNAIAQKEETFKSKFEEANILMEEKWYPKALEIWLDLAKEQPDNANINSKIGMCYYYSPTHQVEGIPYFKKAIKNIKANYDPFMYSETGAKTETFFYYAHALHIDYQLDSAIYYFNKFKETANKKHMLQVDATRQIEMCLNAKKIIEKPDDVVINNLGSKVNSIYPEHSPVLSLDESEIFFTSKRLRADSANFKTKEESSGEYFEDVYVSYKDLSGEWSEPELLNFNRYTQHHATIALSSDNQTLYIYQDDGGDGNLYSSILLGDRWSTPEKMNDDINSKSYETHLTISVDGKTLYFTSDRKGGLGGMDIYMSKKLPNGDWGKPINVGEPINTQYDEESPYIHPDGTMYFSSKGHESMGGYDIFYSEPNDDGTWTTPINIGYPINSTHDDIYYTTTPDGKRAYYSSFGGKNNIGEKDIYIIEQKSFEEKALTLLKGHVHAPPGEQLPENVMVYLTDNETGEMIGQHPVNKRTGSYVFIIPPGRNYNISYEADGNEIYNENIYVPVGSEYNEINKEILLDAVHMKGQEILAESTKEGEKYYVKFSVLDMDLNNLTLKCIDENGNIIFEEKADNQGRFAFEHLPSDRDYLFEFYNESGKMIDCAGKEIQLFKNENMQAIFHPNSDCVFEDDQRGKRGRVSFTTLPSIPESLIVQYLDDEGNVIYTEEVNEDGYFKYHELEGDKVNLKLIGNVPCEDANMQIVDKIDESLVFIGFENLNNCDFTPVFEIDEKSEKGFISFSKLPTIPENISIQYIDDNGKVLFTEKVKKDGSFKYHELNSDKYKLKLLGDVPCEEANIKIVDKLDINTELIGFELNSNCDFSPLVKKAINKPKFEEYFTYNKNIPQRNKEFEDFINKAVEVAKTEGMLKISIESSASRVPTKTHGTNDNLTKLRAENAKTMILDKLAAQGVSKDKVKFINVTTLVQGPKYQGDYIDNKSTYEKYQYVKVKVE